MKAREGTGASLRQKGDRYEAEKLYRPECTWRLNHVTIQKLHRENLRDSAHATPATSRFHLLKGHLATAQIRIHVIIVQIQSNKCPPYIAECYKQKRF